MICECRYILWHLFIEPLSLEFSFSRFLSGTGRDGGTVPFIIWGCGSHRPVIKVGVSAPPAHPGRHPYALPEGCPRGSGRFRCRRAVFRWTSLSVEMPVGPVAGVTPFSQCPVPRCSPTVDPGRLLLAHTRPSDPTFRQSSPVSPVPLDRTANTIDHFRIDLNDDSVLYLTRVLNTRCCDYKFINNS